MSNDSEIVDGELLPSESEPQALARIERQAVVSVDPRGTIEVSLPSGNVLVPLGDEEAGALAADQLYIAFYNLSGHVPDPEDFEGIRDKTEQERYEMGLPPRGQAGTAENPIKLLTAHAGQPLVVEKRLGIAPIHEKENWSSQHEKRGDRRLSARLIFQTAGWITSFALGTRKDGILLAAHLHEPIPTKPGNGLKFGLRLSELRQALPAPPTQRSLHGQTESERRHLSKRQGVEEASARLRENRPRAGESVDRGGPARRQDLARHGGDVDADRHSAAHPGAPRRRDHAEDD